jgi:hypothetical protein
VGLVFPLINDATGQFEEPVDWTTSTLAGPGYVFLKSSLATNTALGSIPLTTSIGYDAGNAFLQLTTEGTKIAFNFAGSEYASISNAGVLTALSLVASSATGGVSAPVLKLGGAYEEKTFSASFPDATANQKVDIQLGNIAVTAIIEITLASQYGFFNAAGRVVKRYLLSAAANNVIYQNQANYAEAFGPVANQFALSDITWDATNTRYRIQIVNRTSSGNPVAVMIRTFAAGGVNTFADGIALGAVYTTDATVFPAPTPGLTSSIADSASTIAHTLDTTVSLVTGGAKLLSIKNAGTEKASVDQLGNIRAGGSGVTPIVLDPNTYGSTWAGIWMTQSARAATNYTFLSSGNGSLYINSEDAAAGKIGFRFNNVDKASFDYYGNLTTGGSSRPVALDSSTVTNWAGMWLTAGGRTSNNYAVLSNFGNPGSSGILALNVEDNTTGKLSIRFANVEKAWIDYNGVLSVAGLASGTLPTMARRLYENRAVPTTAGNYVEIGNLSVGYGAHSIHLYISVPASGFSVAKSYEISAFYNSTGGTWMTVPASSSSGAYPGPNDFDLEVNGAASVMSFRIRRTAGTVAGTAYVTGIYANDADVWTGTSGTGTSTATGYFDPGGIFSTLKSAVPSTGSAVGNIIDTYAAYAAGDKILSVRTGGNEKFYVDTLGNAVAVGTFSTVGGGFSASSAGTVLTTTIGNASDGYARLGMGANSFTTLIGNAAASGPSYGVKFGNRNALASGDKIATFYSDNLVTERAYIDYLGGVFAPTYDTSTVTTMGIGGVKATDIYIGRGAGFVTYSTNILSVTGGGAGWAPLRVTGTSTDILHLGQVTNIYAYIGNGKYTTNYNWQTPTTYASNIRFGGTGSGPAVIEFTTDTGLTANTDYTPSVRMAISATGVVSVTGGVQSWGAAGTGQTWHDTTVQAGYGGIWFGNNARTVTNYSMLGDSVNTLINSTLAGHIYLRNANNNIIDVASSGATFGGTSTFGLMAFTTSGGIQMPDNRTVVPSPADYGSYVKFVGMKYNGSGGGLVATPTPDGSAYAGLIGIGWYQDDSAGRARGELAFTGNGNIFWRTGLVTGATYNAWSKVSLETSLTADGATAVAHVLDTPSAGYITAGSKLLSVRNATVEKAAIDLLGGITASSIALGGTSVYAGFNDRTTSTLGFVDGTRVFTLTNVGTCYVWTNNVRYAKAAPVTVTIANTVGLHFIYFDSTGTLVESTSAWDVTSDQIAPVATVYWDGTTGVVGDERHSAFRSRAAHAYLHSTRGTAYDSGLTGTFTNTTLSVATGTVWDEDLKFSLTGPFTTCRLWYTKTGGTVLTSNTASTTPYAVNTGTLQYDAAGTLTNVPSSNYVVNWVYATNDKDYPVAVVVSQTTYGTLGSSRTAAQPNFPNISIREWKLLYSITYRNAAGTPTFIEQVDYRNASSLPNASVASLPAVSVTVTPAGNIASVNVQAALEELDAEKFPYTGGTLTGSLTVPTSAGAPFLAQKITGTAADALHLGQVVNSYSYIGSALYYNSGYWQTPTTTAAAIKFLNDGSMQFLTDTGLTANTNYAASSRMGLDATGLLAITKNAGTVLAIGALTNVSTTTPATLSLGATYSSVAGLYPKLKIYDDGSAWFGLGVSAAQLDIGSSVASSVAFWSGGSKVAFHDTSGNASFAAASANYPTLDATTVTGWSGLWTQGATARTVTNYALLGSAANTYVNANSPSNNGTVALRINNNIRLSIADPVSNGSAVVAQFDTTTPYATPGDKLVQFSNAGSPKAWINYAGTYETTSGQVKAVSFYSATAGNGVTLGGQAPDGGTAVTLTNSVSMATGRLVSFQSNGSEKAYIDALGGYNGSIIPTYLGWGTSMGVFGQPLFLINELSDVLWRAAERFTITGWAGTSSLFDGSFDSSVTVPPSTTTVMNINVGSITYPSGTIYVSFYFTYNTYVSMSLRTKKGGTWYAEAAPTNVANNPGTNKVMAFSVGNVAYLSDIELTITTDATPVWMTSINYVLARNAGNETPYVNKYALGNNLFGTLQLGNAASTSQLNVYGKTVLGSGYTGLQVGDLSIARTAAPTTGALFFNNAGDRYLYYDGAAYNFSVAPINVGQVVSNPGNGSPSGVFSSLDPTADFNLASSGVIKLTNTSATANNNVSIDFFDSTGNVVARMGAARLDHTNHAASLGFVVRSNSGTYAERMTLSNALDGSTATALTVNSAAYSNSTSKLLSLKNNTLEKMYVRYDGATFAPSFNASSAVYSNILAASVGPLYHQGTSPDGGSSTGNVFYNYYAQTFPGSKIASFFSDNFVTERLYIDNVGRVNAPGQLTLKANGLPGGTTVTNLCLYSEAFDNAAWTKAGAVSAAPTVTPNTTTSPAQTVTAETIAIPAVAAGSYSSVGQAISLAGSTQYVFSVWLKAAVAGSTYLYVYNAGFYTQIILNVTTDWQRFYVPFTTAGAGTYTCYIGCDTVTSGTIMGTTSAITLYAWGAQVETGPAPSAYVGTAGSTAASTQARGVVVDTQRGFTNGYLFTARNAGLDRFTVDFNGSSYSWAVNSTTGTFSANAGNPVYLQGNASSTGSARGVLIGNTAALAAGDRIASFYGDNFASEKAWINYDGTASFAAGNTILGNNIVYANQFSANSGSVTLHGNALTTGSATSIILNSLQTMAAGDKLLSIRNNGVGNEKVSVSYAGVIATNGGLTTLSGFSIPVTGAKLTLAAPLNNYASLNLPAGGTPTAATGDLWFDGTALNFQTGTGPVNLLNAANGLYVPLAGNVHVSGDVYFDSVGGIHATQVQSTYYVGYPTLGFIFNSYLSAGDAGTDFVMGSYTARAAGKLFSLRTNTNFTPVEKFYIDYLGNLLSTTSVAATSGATLVNSPTYTLRANYWSGSAGTDYDLALQHVPVTTGPSTKLSLQFGGSEKMYFTNTGQAWFQGTVWVGNGVGGVVAANMQPTGTANSLIFRGTLAASGSSKGTVIDTTATYAAGDKLLSIANNTVEKTFFNYDGSLTFLVNTGKLIQLGSTTSTGTATPVQVDLGGTYSSSAGVNPKMIVYDDGSAKWGIGVSASQMDYMSPASTSHAFWVGATKIFYSNSATNDLYSSGSYVAGASSTKGFYGATGYSALLCGQVVSSSTAISVVLNTPSSYPAGAKIASFQNNTAEKAYIDAYGTISAGPGYVVASGLNLGGLTLNTTNYPGLALIGWNYSNGSGEVDIIATGGATSGGLNVYNRTTAGVMTRMASIGTTTAFDGKVTAPGFDASSQKITSVAAGSAATDAVNFGQMVFGQYGSIYVSTGVGLSISTTYAAFSTSTWSVSATLSGFTSTAAGVLTATNAGTYLISYSFSWSPANAGTTTVAIHTGPAAATIQNSTISAVYGGTTAQFFQAGTAILTLAAGDQIVLKAKTNGSNVTVTPLNASITATRLA